MLVEGGAAFVGIDSHNIDDTRTRARPVHSLLLGAGIPIGEHLTGLEQLPDQRLSLLRRAAQGEGHGHLPGARLRSAETERRLQPRGNDGVLRDGVGAGMDDGQAQAPDRRCAPDSPPSPSTTTSRRLTFCRQFIRAVFSWPTKQPLEKLTPLSSAALHSSQSRSPKLGTAFADAEAQAMLEPAHRGLVRPGQASAGRAQPAEDRRRPRRPRATNGRPGHRRARSLIGRRSR